MSSSSFFYHLGVVRNKSLMHDFEWEKEVRIEDPISIPTQDMLIGQDILFLYLLFWIFFGKPSKLSYLYCVPFEILSFLFQNISIFIDETLYDFEIQLLYS